MCVCVCKRERERERVREKGRKELANWSNLLMVRCIASGKCLN